MTYLDPVVVLALAPFALNVQRRITLRGTDSADVQDRGAAMHLTRQEVESEVIECTFSLVEQAALDRLVEAYRSSRAGALPVAIVDETGAQVTVWWTNAGEVQQELRRTTGSVSLTFEVLQ